MVMRPSRIALGRGQAGASSRRRIPCTPALCWPYHLHISSIHQHLRHAGGCAHMGVTEEVVQIPRVPGTPRPGRREIILLAILELVQLEGAFDVGRETKRSILPSESHFMSASTPRRVGRSEPWMGMMGNSWSMPSCRQRLNTEKLQKYVSERIPPDLRAPRVILSSLRQHRGSGPGFAQYNRSQCANSSDTARCEHSDLLTRRQRIVV